MYAVGYTKMQIQPLKTGIHTPKHNTFTLKNHLKNYKLEVRHAFQSKSCNQKLDQNTKTTHQKNLTKIKHLKA